MNRGKAVLSGLRFAGDDDRQNPVHPGCWPRTVGRKNPLHIYAEVNAALGQRKRQELIAHQRSSFMEQSRPEAGASDYAACFIFLAF
jgi:hypothetical protein